MEVDIVMYTRDVPQNISIIGGGILGLTMACKLLKQGFSVTLIDGEGVSGSASSATAGIIGGSTVIPWASTDLWTSVPKTLLNPDGPLRVIWPPPKNILPFIFKSIKAGTSRQRIKSAKGLAELGLRGWKAWMRLSVDYPELKSLFNQNGCLLYYSNSQEKYHDLENNRTRKELGMRLMPLESKGIRDLLPCVTDATPSGILIDRAGHINDPIVFQSTLRDLIKKSGGTFACQNAIGFITEAGYVRAVKTRLGNIDCDVAIICAGAGSAALSKKLSTKTCVLPAWGASITLHEPEIILKLPLLSQAAGIAVLPNLNALRVAGLLQLGGYSKYREKLMEKILLRYVQKLFGDFSYQRLTGQFGPRPLTPDSLPVLGFAPNYKNVYFNFGHGHWGVTHAAISANIISDLIIDGTSELDITPYKADRF